MLAVVVAATLATMAAEIPGRSNGGVGIVLLVALYSVAAHCPRRQAAWAGIATGAVLAWPLWTATGGIGPVWAGSWPRWSAWFSGAWVAVRRLRE